MKILKSLRTQKGVSQREIGSYLGITGQAYSNYENGKREADFETLLKLGEYFDVSVDYLLTGEEEKKTPTLTEKDERDIQIKADELLSGLGAEGLMLDGNPLSEEAAELFRNAVLAGLRDARIINKIKQSQQQQQKE